MLCREIGQPAQFMFCMFWKPMHTARLRFAQTRAVWVWFEKVFWPIVVRMFCFPKSWKCPVSNDCTNALKAQLYPCCTLSLASFECLDDFVAREPYDFGLVELFAAALHKKCKAPGAGGLQRPQKGFNVKQNHRQNTALRYIESPFVSPFLKIVGETVIGHSSTRLL